MINKIFDEYERRARLYPALIVLSPVILNVYLIVPEIRSLSKTIISLCISLGLLELLTFVSRTRGKSKEKMLFEQWGGVPTSKLLRHSDNTIDPLTKTRYHNYLMEAIKNYKVPSPGDEADSITFADSVYESGIRWLREKTRDKKAYPLVFKENVGYGFSRNLWALKNVSILLLLVSIVLNFIVFHIKQGNQIFSYTYEFWATNAISVGLLFTWMFFINKSFVRSAAESYARALLAVCDNTSELMSKPQRRTKKKIDTANDVNF